MSKFDRYKKKTESYIYPHKHCQKCGQIIKELDNYCTDCYKLLKERKKKKKRFKRKKDTEDSIKSEDDKK